MTYEEVEYKFDRGELDDQYAEYIMANALIGNGTMLINAMESGEYIDGFLDYYYGNCQ